jgi:3-isopropylmalate dehydrogenase
VAVKRAGLEAVSELWRELAQQAAAESDVELSVVDVDLIAYQLLERPRAFDVVAAPNMLGDILSDVASALVGLRSLAFGASFTPEGEAVYQTNHGSAHDIAGTDRANPLAQILSLAMLLRESLGLGREADAIERGIQLIGRDAFVTEDLARSGSTVIGTREMGMLVAEAAATELTRIPGRAVRVSAL